MAWHFLLKRALKGTADFLNIKNNQQVTIHTHCFNLTLTFPVRPSLKPWSRSKNDAELSQFGLCVLLVLILEMCQWMHWKLTLLSGLLTLDSRL